MLSEKLRRLCFQCSHSTNNDELEQVVILVLPQGIRGATQGEEAAQAFHKKFQIKKKMKMRTYSKGIGRVPCQFWGAQEKSF
jgi:hypothetical protein